MIEELKALKENTQDKECKSLINDLIYLQDIIDNIPLEDEENYMRLFELFNTIYQDKLSTLKHRIGIKYVKNNTKTMGNKPNT